jgi:hypothetical protein
MLTNYYLRANLKECGMTPLPRSLAVQQITIAILLIVALFQAYLALSAPEGLSLRGFALIGSPLGSMFTFLGIYPRFNQTAIRIPMVAIGLGLMISSVYILFMQRFS